MATDILISISVSFPGPGGFLFVFNIVIHKLWNSSNIGESLTTIMLSTKKKERKKDGNVHEQLQQYKNSSNINRSWGLVSLTDRVVFRSFNLSGVPGNPHVGPGLRPLQLHGQEQHRDSIPGVHSGPGRWVRGQFQHNKTGVFYFDSPLVNVSSQEAHAPKKSRVTVPLLELGLTVMASFAIHSEINPTTTTAGPLFSLA